MFLNRDPDAPKEILNWRLWFGGVWCVAVASESLGRLLNRHAVFGLMGAARGLDEGLTGTTASLKSFQATFGLKDPALSKAEQANRLSNITSMVQMGSILGALVRLLPDGQDWSTLGDPRALHCSG